MTAIRYPLRATIISPEALYLAGTLQRLGVAFNEESTGGERNFDAIRASKAGLPYRVCDALVRQHTGEFMASATPAALHAYCLADYSARHPDAVAPTLVECSAFLAQSVIVVAERDDTLPVAAVLASRGFEVEQLKEPGNLSL